MCDDGVDDILEDFVDAWHVAHQEPVEDCHEIVNQGHEWVWSVGMVSWCNVNDFLKLLSLGLCGVITVFLNLNLDERFLRLSFVSHFLSCTYYK